MTTTAAAVYRRQQELRAARDRYDAALSAPGVLAGSIAETRAMAEVDRLAAEVEALQAEIGGVVYRAAAVHLDWLQAMAARMSRRAGRLGVEPVKLTVTDEREFIPRVNEHGNRVAVEHAYIVLAGRAPRLAGWRFVAVLDHLDAQGLAGPDAVAPVAIRRVPFAPRVDLEQYRHAENRCDHCGLIRDRHRTFVVQHEDGRLMQVGSACLRDFLGGADPHAAAAWAELVCEFDLAMSETIADGPVRFDAGGVGIPLAEFAAAAAACVRVHGWEARRDAFGDPNPCATADLALQLVLRPDLARDVTVEEQDRDLAGRAIAWVRGDLARRERLSEFECQLAANCAAEWVTAKGIGVAAYLPVAYQRETARAERAAQLARSRHVGTVGERVKLDLTCEFVRAFDGPYGPRFLCKLADRDGNRFVWWGSRRLEPGRRYVGAATIKAHATDRYADDAPVTEIRNFRARLADDDAAAAGCAPAMAAA